MRRMGRPVTSAEAAVETGLAERWIREWADNRLPPSSIIPFEDGDDVRFWMNPEEVEVLATPGHPAFGMGLFHRLPQSMGALVHLTESFRTGPRPRLRQLRSRGRGRLERSFEPWYRDFLLPVVLPGSKASWRSSRGAP